MIRTIVEKLTPKKLQTRIIIMVVALLTILIVTIGGVLSAFTAQTLRDDIGAKALAVAKTFAANNEVRQLVETNDPGGRLQQLAEQVRIDSGATFVVVADRERRRFSHPDPSLIGLVSQSTDSFPVLEEGKSIASLRLGATGYSIRGKTPVYDHSQNIIGYVSVGYNIRKVSGIIQKENLKIVPWILLVTGLGVIGSFWLSSRFKKAIFNLEPEEIAALFQERNTIIETIREGVIACDQDGRITLVNQAALANLGTSHAHEILGRDLSEFFPEDAIHNLLHSRRKHFDIDANLLNEEMIFNISPLLKEGQQAGMVASFRRKDEMDALVKELSTVKQYADTLRAQAHEHSNILHTVAGLLQLEAYEEALDLIICEETSYKGLFELLSLTTTDQTLTALLIGKYNHARELGATLEIDAPDGKTEIPEYLDRHTLVTIVGNLLDNACEAVQVKPREQRKVRLSLTRGPELLKIQVHDSGNGVDPALGDAIFTKGVSGKDGNGRGIGLYLVTRAVDSLCGSVSYTQSVMGGACFTVSLPLNMREDDEYRQSIDR